MPQIVGVLAYTGTSNTGTTDVLMPEVVDPPLINSIHKTDFKLEDVCQNTPNTYFSHFRLLLFRTMLRPHAGVSVVYLQYPHGHSSLRSLLAVSSWTFYLVYKGNLCSSLALALTWFSLILTMSESDSN